MAGELTASLPIIKNAEDAAGIKTAIDAIVLAAATDFLFVLPMRSTQQVMIFKVVRAA